VNAASGTDSRPSGEALIKHAALVDQVRNTAGVR
jgi:hypothetical protein